MRIPRCFSTPINPRGIIFVNQINQVKEVFKYLEEALPNKKIALLHGDLSGKERQRVHKDFVNKKYQILVATDIAARGIDIPDLRPINTKSFISGRPSNNLEDLVRRLFD